MGWWLVLFWVGSTVLNELLRPKPRFDAPQPAGISDFQVPTADASRAIPVVFGTVMLRGPNVVWYGDLRVEAIVDWVKTGWFSGTHVTYGYKYLLGLDLVLCHGPIESLRQVWVGDKAPITTGPVTHSDHWTYTWPWDANRGLFGDPKTGEGGVGGSFDVYWGASAQDPSPYLVAKAGADYPGLGSCCHIVFPQCYLGNSPYIKDMAFVVDRFPNTLGLLSGKHKIAPSPADGMYDANPACVLYEILTNTTWGMGLPTSALDPTSFMAAGNALHAEGLGVSMVFDRQADAGDYLEEVLRHVDGAVYSDPETGLLTMKLARADYDPGALLVLDETNADSVEFSRGGWSETSNVAKVNYTSRADRFTARVAQAQNLANVQVRGGELSVETYDFRGLSNGGTAMLAAARCARTTSFPLARIKLSANRSAWKLRPCGLFVLNWPPLGITGMACRVRKLNYGSLVGGSIAVEAVEDVFGVPETGYSAPGPSGWVDPVGDPAPAAFQEHAECPYQLTKSAAQYLLVMAARSQMDEMGYEVWSKATGDYAKTNLSPAFTATGTLVAEYPESGADEDDTGFTVEDVYDPQQVVACSDSEYRSGVNLVMVGDEVMGWRDLVDNLDGTLTVKHVMRGVLDTAPRTHAAGARVWFISPGGVAMVNPDAPYTTSPTIYMKLLPFNTRQTLLEAAATAMSHAVSGRAGYAYPPGNVRVNGVMWPSSLAAGADAVFTWAHRHRVDQGAEGRLVRQSEGSYSAAAESAYALQVYVNGVLKRTEAPSASTTTWTYTFAMKTADDPDPSHVVTLRMWGGTASAPFYQERSFLMPNP